MSMELKASQSIVADVIIIGGGAAGLRAAIAAMQHGLDVLLLSESPVGFKNNSAIAKGGVVAVGVRKGIGDSPEAYFKDTVTAGRFIGDRKLIAVMVEGARQQIDDLTEFGVHFIQHGVELRVKGTPGHTYPRMVEANKGINITRPLRRYAKSIGTRFMEGVLVARLLRVGNAVVGVLGIDNKGQLLIIKAKSTVLATGGLGGIYLRTNNAMGLTGDGYALGYEAGAVLRDMEFTQFYATASGKQGNKMTFMYEWALPAGAILRNSLGEDILQKHGMKDYASLTRDLIARAVVREVIEGRGIDGQVVLDLTTIPEEGADKLYRNKFISSKAALVKVLVAPAAHYFMGGVKIDENGETGVDGLYAAGEVCGGIHGANRIGGNALTEAFVFGTIAGNQAAGRAAKIKMVPIPEGEVMSEVAGLRRLASGRGGINPDQLVQSLRQTMWDKAGIIRDKQNLEDGLNKILALREQLPTVSVTGYRQLYRVIKLMKMITVSEMICRAALMRTESRGTHYRADFPAEDDQWLKAIEIHFLDGDMALTAVPVLAD